MKARSDASTGMLLISLLALVLGGTLLFLDCHSYGAARPPSVSLPALDGR